MSSCPKKCGPLGDTISNLKPDEEPAGLSSKRHYSCFKPANTSREKLEEEAENIASGKSEFKEAKDTSCEKPKEEPANENTSYNKPEEEVEEIQAAVQEDGDGKQKRKEIEHSSLFNIADTNSDDVDRMRIPDPNAVVEEEKLVQKYRSQNPPSTTSPRELLQSSMLPPATSQQVYDDHAN